MRQVRHQYEYYKLQVQILGWGHGTHFFTFLLGLICMVHFRKRACARSSWGSHTLTDLGTRGPPQFILFRFHAFFLVHIIRNNRLTPLSGVDPPGKFWIHKDNYCVLLNKIFQYFCFHRLPVSSKKSARTEKHVYGNLLLVSHLDTHLPIKALTQILNLQLITLSVHLRKYKFYFTALGFFTLTRMIPTPLHLAALQHFNNFLSTFSITNYENGIRNEWSCWTQAKRVLQNAKIFCWFSRIRSNLIILLLFSISTL